MSLGKPPKTGLLTSSYTKPGPNNPCPPCIPGLPRVTANTYMVLCFPTSQALFQGLPCSDSVKPHYNSTKESPLMSPFCT